MSHLAKQAILLFSNASALWHVVNSGECDEEQTIAGDLIAIPKHFKVVSVGKKPVLRARSERTR